MSEASCIYLFKALSLSYFEYRRFKCQLFTGNGMFVCVDDQAVFCCFVHDGFLYHSRQAHGV